MEKDNMKNEQQCAIHDVSGSVLTTTTKRELGKYEFFCEKCKRLHTMSAYAVAQLTMGHELIFSCPCGEKITLEPFFLEDFFPKEVELVKQKKCPFCKSDIDEEDFVDELSRREYKISGLCQSCQDEMFGGKRQNKKNKQKEMTKEEAAKLLNVDLTKVVDESCFGNFEDLRGPFELWERHPSKDPNKVYFLPAVDNDFVKASNVHCQVNLVDKKRSEGYGGSVWKFKCTDGNEYEVQGPWHSNTDALFDATGIDLRNKHKFHIIICEKTVYDIVSDNRLKHDYFKPDKEYELRSRAAHCIWKDPGYRFQGYNLLHRYVWTGAWYDREYEVAKKVVEHGKEVYYTIQSSGGASSQNMTVEKAKEIIENRVKELNKSFGT